MSEEYNEFDAGAVDTIDQSSVESTGPQYPVVQWNYGDNKAKRAGGMAYQGGWFVKAEFADETAMTAAGWTKEIWTHDSGTEEEGFWRREMAVSVIALRKRWEVNGDGPRMSFAWNDYDKASAVGKATGRTHVLVLIKGLEAQGPFVLTLKSSAAMGFEGGRNSAGALTKFAQTVIRRANLESDAAAKKAGKTAGKKWPYRAFWLPVGANRDKDGVPIFVEVGKDKNTKLVCVPAALGLPEKAEQVDLKRFYVGNDLLKQVNDLFAENVEWVNAWANIIPGATDNSVTVTLEVEEPTLDDAALAATGL